MEFAKKFLGKEKDAIIIDDALFNKLFYTGANKDLIIIKSRIPIPHQDVSNQHTHDNFEFTVPLSHNPKLLIENKQFTLPIKNIFPSNPGQYHGPAEVAYHHKIIAIQISKYFLEEIAYILFGNRNILFENEPAPLEPQLENLIDLFISESQNKQAGYEFILDHLSCLLGASILRALTSNLDLHEKRFNSVSKKEINRALDYLHTNINQDFSLNEVADLIGLSKYHFIRLFKKETGQTPYQYYLDLKIEKAVELIKTNQYSITDICFICGFKDHSHFSRMFIKKMGITPSHFKELCK